jgi:multidrug efflux pump subunit AcrB
MMCATFFRSSQDSGRLVQAIDRNFEWFRERYRRALHALLETCRSSS